MHRITRGQFFHRVRTDRLIRSSRAEEQFRSFKSSVRKEFTEWLDSHALSQGATATKAVIDDAKANYYEKFSQINMTKEEVKKKGYEKIRQLITDELNHVKQL